MIDVIELIPSRDMRRALRESGRVFTDMEKATIIHNRGLPSFLRRKLLEELASETDDELVREQLRWTLDEERRMLDWAGKTGENCLLAVRKTYASNLEDQFGTYFPDTYDGEEAATALGRSFIAPFQVMQWKMIPDGGAFFFSGRCQFYKADGHMTASGFIEPPPLMRGRWPSYFHFENRWIDLPNLYECGDVVRICWGVACRSNMATDWAVTDVDAACEEEKRQRMRELFRRLEAGDEGLLWRPRDEFLSIFHLQVLVRYFATNTDTSLDFDYVNPMFLEKKVEGSPDDAGPNLRKELQGLRQREYEQGQVSDVLRRHTWPGVDGRPLYVR